VGKATSEIKTEIDPLRAEELQKKLLMYRFYVKKILGYKSKQNTLIYIDLKNVLLKTTNDQFIVRVASNVKKPANL